jgi:hypothetical protein
MKVLLLTLEPPLRDDEVVSGNAVRTRQLSEAVQGDGHEIANAWLLKAARREDPRREFLNADDLQIGRVSCQLRQRQRGS